MICEVITVIIQIVSHALSMTNDQPFGNSSVEYIMGLVTCVRSRTHPQKFEKQNLEKINFLVYEKMLILHFSFLKKCLS